MRIGVVGCFHETNTFAPGKTDICAFEGEWIIGKAPFYAQYAGTKTSMGGVIDAAASEGFELVPLFYTQATPSGMVSGEAMDTIAHTMCAQLEASSGDLDGLIMILHGAMVSENAQDVEGVLLKRLRERFGAKPIALTLDLHANISTDMVSLTDVLVGYDTYPHVDAYERAVEACALLAAVIRKDVQPTPHLERPNLLIAPSRMDTKTEPMQTLMQMAFEYEKDAEVLNIVIAGGFPYSDVSFAGMSITVITNNNPEKAKQIAKELSSWAWKQRECFRAHLVSVAQALTNTRERGAYPTIVIESSDNVGGGAPADATHVLKTLIEKKQEGFLMVIADPEAVQEAQSLGIDGHFSAYVGGKTDKRYGLVPQHGEPVYIKGRVRLLSDGHYVHRGPYMAGQRAEMGRTAVIEVEDCPHSVIVCTAERVPPWDVNHVRSIGIEPGEFKVIVVKSAIAWQTAFGEVAKHVVEVDTPGCCSVNLQHFTYRRVPDGVYIL